MSITLQPWKLKLLSIPKTYSKSITSCTHAIVKNIFFPRRYVVVDAESQKAKEQRGKTIHLFFGTNLFLQYLFQTSRDCLFSFTQNALELAVVADVDVVAQDFLSLNLEGLMVTDDVFCAFMVDDPDGIGKKREHEHANKQRRLMFFPALFFSYFLLPSKLICVSIMPCMHGKGTKTGVYKKCVPWKKELDQSLLWGGQTI